VALLYGRSMASCPEDAIGAALCTIDAGITGQRCCAFVTYRCGARRRSQRCLHCVHTCSAGSAPAHNTLAAEALQAVPIIS
jgi:hypothetical protein